MSASAPPVVRIPLSVGLTPDRALDRLRPLGHSALLESCGGGGRTILAAAPRALFRWSDGKGSLLERDPGGALRSPSGAASRGTRRMSDPLRTLEGLLRPGGLPDTRPDATFAGGWIGYIGYEIADALERLPPAPPRSGDDLPTLWWAAYDWAVVWGSDDRPPRLEGTPLVRNDVRELERRMEGVATLLEADDRAQPRPTPPVDGSPEPLRSSLGRSGFVDGVEQIRRYIRDGDLFQANLTHRLSASFPAGGLALYRALRACSPAVYAAYIDTGEGEVASISPESFLSLRGRRVETRPIKGTAPRGADPEADAEQARRLLESGKERAENVMIVDLLRNDLSRVCRAGSVRVPRLLELEAHPTVHHLVSTVEGELEPGAGAVDLLRATLPGGSITGAPKIRAMEVLRELEPVRRGVYTGALGILEPGGDLDLAVAIRTATIRGGRARYGTGCGITLDSDPAAEWRESLDKAAPFLQALGADGAASTAEITE